MTTAATHAFRPQVPGIMKAVAGLHLASGGLGARQLSIEQRLADVKKKGPPLCYHCRIPLVRAEDVRDGKRCPKCGDCETTAWELNCMDYDTFAGTHMVKMLLDQLEPFTYGLDEVEIPPTTVADNPRNPDGTEVSYVGLKAAEKGLDELVAYLEAEYDTGDDPLYRIAVCGSYIMQSIVSRIDGFRIPPDELAESEIAELEASITEADEPLLATAV